MTFLLRTARENDLEALYRMAKGTGRIGNSTA